jgi:hypothetical protein
MPSDAISENKVFASEGLNPRCRHSLDYILLEGDTIERN